VAPSEVPRSWYPTLQAVIAVAPPFRARNLVRRAEDLAAEHLLNNDLVVRAARRARQEARRRATLATLAPPVVALVSVVLGRSLGTDSALRVAELLLAVVLTVAGASWLRRISRPPFWLVPRARPRYEHRPANGRELSDALYQASLLVAVGMPPLSALERVTPIEEDNAARQVIRGLATPRVQPEALPAPRWLVAALRDVGRDPFPAASLTEAARRVDTERRVLAAGWPRQARLAATLPVVTCILPAIVLVLLTPPLDLTRTLVPALLGVAILVSAIAPWPHVADRSSEVGEEEDQTSSAPVAARRVLTYAGAQVRLVGRGASAVPKLARGLASARSRPARREATADAGSTPESAGASVRVTESNVDEHPTIAPHEADEDQVGSTPSSSEAHPSTTSSGGVSLEARLAEMRATTRVIEQRARYEASQEVRLAEWTLGSLPAATLLLVSALNFDRSAGWLTDGTALLLLLAAIALTLAGLRWLRRLARPPFAAFPSRQPWYLQQAGRHQELSDTFERAAVMARTTGTPANDAVQQATAADPGDAGRRFVAAAILDPDPTAAGEVAPAWLFGALNELDGAADMLERAVASLHRDRRSLADRWPARVRRAAAVPFVLCFLPATLLVITALGRGS
jgi:hypothetical protein